MNFSAPFTHFDSFFLFSFFFGGMGLQGSGKRVNFLKLQLFKGGGGKERGGYNAVINIDLEPR